MELKFADGFFVCVRVLYGQWSLIQQNPDGPCHPLFGSWVNNKELFSRATADLEPGRRGKTMRDLRLVRCGFAVLDLGTLQTLNKRGYRYGRKRPSTGPPTKKHRKRSYGNGSYVHPAFGSWLAAKATCAMQWSGCAWAGFWSRIWAAWKAVVIFSPSSCKPPHIGGLEGARACKV